MKRNASNNTIKLKIMSVDPTKRALPYLSAITPPNKTKRIKGNVRANITKLNEVALPSGRSKTPNARAIGPIPFPIFEINRAEKSIRKFFSTNTSLN